jgi:CelD/BcsL family acetyltransferase involved in cellulose biosynthesis
LRGCGLVRWHFNHLLASQEPFIKYHVLREISPLLDLNDGFEAYAAGLRLAGSKVLERIGARKRKLERDVGPVRFEAQVLDSKTLDLLLRWKAAQYVRTGYASPFQTGWIRGLIERIHAAQDEDFAGMLSVLYAGDQLIAGHFGMRSRSIWHYWFPSYDVNFGAYSPGLITLLEMARSAQALGLSAIDLGRGLSPYKRRLMNASVPIAEGVVELPP